MIREEYVTYETAKLLKKCGFPQEDNPPFTYPYAYGIDSNPICYKTTQALAMRWLREYCYVQVGIVFNTRDDWGYCLEPISKDKYKYFLMERYNLSEIHPTYEQAAEAGIKAACEYIIKNERL